LSKQPRTPVSEDQIRRDRAAWEFNKQWAKDNPKSRPRPKPAATEATSLAGRTISESQAGDIADQLIAQMQNPTPAELTAAQLAKLEPGDDRSGVEAEYWGQKMRGHSPFWSN